MNTVAMDYIWQTIRESERSDEIQFMDEELRMKAEAARLAQLLRIQATVEASRELIRPTVLIPVPGQ